MFFNKPIDLHFYTTEEYVYKFANIRTGRDTKADWFKRLRPSTLLNTNIPKKTLKACPGIQDYYKTAIQVPLWSDLSLQIGPKGADSFKWVFSDGLSVIRDHPSENINNYREKEDFQQLLLQSPWIVKCNRDVNFLMCQPIWHSFDFPTMSITQGVINFFHQRHSNIQLCMTRTHKTQDMLVKHGTSIVELVPLTEKKIKVHTHLIGKLEYEKLKSINPYTKFTNSYYYNRALAKKCPVSE